MSNFSAQIKINASKEQVWAVLSDLGSIYKWNPGVSHSYSTSESSGGEGATRHCDIQTPLKGYLEERAFDWREGESFKIDIYDTNFPLKRNVVQFSLRTDGSDTVVEVSPEYQLKFGALGAVMDRLAFNRQFRKGMTGLLTGLKYYVETGEEVIDRVPIKEGGSRQQRSGSNHPA